MYDWDSSKIIERSNYALLFNTTKLRSHYFCLMLENPNETISIMNEMDNYYQEKFSVYNLTEKYHKKQMINNMP